MGDFQQLVAGHRPAGTQAIFVTMPEQDVTIDIFTFTNAPGSFGDQQPDISARGRPRTP